MTQQNTVPGESWLSFISLLTAVLAVVGAISSLKSGGYSTKSQMAAVQENNKWSHFQSKSTKENIVRSQKELLVINVPEFRTLEAKKLAQEKIKFYEQELERYEKEKSEIMLEAKKQNQLQTLFKDQSGNFTIAVTLIQIAVMMASVSSITKKRELFLMGIALGVIGSLYMVNGFFLIV